MDYEKIKNLINDMGVSKLTSLEIDFPDGTKISMKKDNNEQSEKNEMTENIVKSSEIVENMELPKKEDKAEDVYKYIKSPMVGTFYSKPSPTENSFIKVGENIKAGATTCIIEAMKLMNEIEAEFDGEVVEILKHDGEPVEFGENLIKIK